VIIFRYFAKEVFSALIAVTLVLLLIFLSNQFVRYLGLAAMGKLPGIFVFRLMMLEVPNLLGLILPLGLFLGFLLAYGRLYADSEMTVLTACGFGRKQLALYSLIIGLIVTAVVAFLFLYLSPKILADRNQIMFQGRSASLVDTVIPGRFQVASGGKRVVYVQTMSGDRKHVNNIFLAQKETSKTGDSHWSVISAEKGYEKNDAPSEGRFVALKNGYRYDGKPGQKDFQVAHFGEYVFRVPDIPSRTTLKNNALPTSKLWPINNADPKKAAEIQWRLSLPLSVLLLTLLAVPLSYVKPRQGKYAKLLPAGLIYILYANLLFIARSWVAHGKVSPLIGMWWLHAALLLLITILFFRKAR